MKMFSILSRIYRKLRSKERNAFNTPGYAFFSPEAFSRLDIPKNATKPSKITQMRFHLWKNSWIIYNRNAIAEVIPRGSLYCGERFRATVARSHAAPSQIDSSWTFMHNYMKLSLWKPDGGHTKNGMRKVIYRYRIKERRG